MTAVRRVNFCRDLEQERDRLILWFNGYTECVRIEPDDKTKVKQCFIVTDEDGITPICRIDLFRDLEPDEED